MIENIFGNDCPGADKSIFTDGITAYDGAVCPNMKLTTLERVYTSLKEEKTVVEVPVAVSEKARASLERMFQVK